MSFLYVLTMLLGSQVTIIYSMSEDVASNITRPLSKMNTDSNLPVRVHCAVSFVFAFHVLLRNIRQFITLSKFSNGALEPF